MVKVIHWLGSVCPHRYHLMRVKYSALSSSSYVVIKSSILLDAGRSARRGGWCGSHGVYSGVDLLGQCTTRQADLVGLMYPARPAALA